MILLYLRNLTGAPIDSAVARPLSAPASGVSPLNERDEGGGGREGWGRLRARGQFEEKAACGECAADPSHNCGHHAPTFRFQYVSKVTDIPFALRREGGPAACLYSAGSIRVGSKGGRG